MYKHLWWYKLHHGSGHHLACGESAYNQYLFVGRCGARERLEYDPQAYEMGNEACA